MRGITMDLMGAMAAKPLRANMSQSEIDELLHWAKEEIEGYDSHVYLDYCVWYAQKPEHN
jgi:hypothetical protein